MTADESPALDAATETALAKRLYNDTWALLEKPDRSEADVDTLIHLAHASRYHWGNVGKPDNLVIGEWQVARVYSELGRGEPAVYHSLRAKALADAAGVEPWLAASVCEGLARAYYAAGESAPASQWKAKALAGLAVIADQDDRGVIERDIASLPA